MAHPQAIAARGFDQIERRETIPANLAAMAHFGNAGFGQAGVAMRGGPLAFAVMPLIASAALLLMALYVAGVPRVKRVLETAGGFVWRRVQPFSRRFLPANTVPRALGLGAIWGWLPCGMVYAVLITAVAAAGPAQGALVMLAFGVGTLPNVLALGVIASRLKALRLKAVRRVAAVVIASFAVIGPFVAYHVHGSTAEPLYCRAPVSAPGAR